MLTIAERLAYARRLSGLSAMRLGLISGLSRATVALIESGHKRDPASSTIAALARTMGVSADWLLSGTGETPEASAVRGAVQDVVDRGAA